QDLCASRAGTVGLAIFPYIPVHVTQAPGVRIVTRVAPHGGSSAKFRPGRCGSIRLGAIAVCLSPIEAGTEVKGFRIALTPSAGVLPFLIRWQREGARHAERSRRVSSLVEHANELL